jgi:hypothetical protein
MTVKRVRLTVEVLVFDEEALKKFAGRRYQKCWGEPLEEAQPAAGLGDYLYEALIASNGTKEAPLDYGIELEEHWAEVLGEETS